MYSAAGPPNTLRNCFFVKKCFWSRRNAWVSVFSAAEYTVFGSTGSAARLLGRWAARLPGCSAAGLLGCSAPRLLGCSAPGLLGYSAARLLGCPAEDVAAFTDQQISEGGKMSHLCGEMACNSCSTKIGAKSAHGRGRTLFVLQTPTNNSCSKTDEFATRNAILCLCILIQNNIE